MAKGKRINSRQKGAAAEREFAHVLTDHGFDAIRGQQHAGGNDSPDVRCDLLPDFHFEVKRVEASKVPYEWMAQAIRDSKPKKGQPRMKVPVVAHRQNQCEWLAIMRMDDFLALISERELRNMLQ